MTDNDDELFLQEMQGVKKLDTKKKVTLNKATNPTNSSLNQAARKKAATAEVKSVDPNHLSDYDVPQVHPLDVLGYKRPGIQDGVYRKLRLGRYEIEARLDLHRMTIEQARNRVFEFISDCIAHDIRTVLIMPGKGERNIDKPAQLKSYLVHWLPQLDEVQAFHTAQQRHGGAGALYILLKKSDRKKQANREMFNKGRI